MVHYNMLLEKKKTIKIPLPSFNPFPTNIYLNNILLLVKGAKRFLGCPSAVGKDGGQNSLPHMPSYFSTAEELKIRLLLLSISLN